MKIIKTPIHNTNDWEVVEQWDKSKLIDVRYNKKKKNDY